MKRTKCKFFIVSLLLASLLVGCGEPSSEKHPPIANQFVYYEVAGLRIKLPAQPTPNNIKLPAQAAKLVKSMVTYEIKEVHTTVVVGQVVFNIPEGNLDGAADGAIARVKAQPGVTKFTSAIVNVAVSGLQGRSLNMNYKNKGLTYNQYGLVFVRKNVMWQVQVIGVGEDNQQDLEELKKTIFDSVEIQ
ncbi:MAG: hypothetical protein L3J39_02200 [Verrucomicrobiales bacterium]|nr:hypothetical protein [Verrucomicrobiales bacterium]